MRFGVWVLGFGVWNFRIEESGLGYEVWGVGCGVECVGLVECVGFGSRFGVWSVEFEF